MIFLNFNDIQKRKFNILKSTVTMGNFDGMHLGHQHLLKRLKYDAAKNATKSVVIIFEPQPKEFFLKDRSPKRIMPLREKINFLEIWKIDEIICLDFNETLAKLPGKDFVLNFLIKKLFIKKIIIGDDFSFGYKREIGTENLKKLGESENFEVIELERLKKRGIRISSTYIRNLLEKGNLPSANSFLGKKYSLSGVVQHGKKKGRMIGFRTINIPVILSTVLSGVYVVQAYIKKNSFYGIANIGRNILVDTEYLLEVHILNFNEDLYGQYVKVSFLRFLRKEKKFKNIRELEIQLTKDKQSALQFLRIYDKKTKNERL